MPQNEMECWRKLHGRRLDHDERQRKCIAREAHKASDEAQKLTGLRAKLYQKQRPHERIQMKNTPVPQYIFDRSSPRNAKALSSATKSKRSEKAAKFSVPLPKVRGISEEEMFKVIKTGKKTAKKGWKRMITKPAFVGPDFTSTCISRGAWAWIVPFDALLCAIVWVINVQNLGRPVKYERFIRPTGLRYRKANVTHPELGVTAQLPIISVKKNLQNHLYTQMGVLIKGTIIEVNVSELGLVAAGGKVVWGRCCQITNNRENDGCINAVFLV